jgi:hypothetical protein
MRSPHATANQPHHCSLLRRSKDCLLTTSQKWEERNKEMERCHRVTSFVPKWWEGNQMAVALAVVSQGMR